MRELGLQGVRRGGVNRRTTIADPAAARPADLVERQFSPRRSDATYVAGFTYVATWSGTVYVLVTWNHAPGWSLTWRRHHELRGRAVDRP